MTEISFPVTVTATAIAKALASLWSQQTCTAEEAFEEIRIDAIKTDSPKILYASLGTAEVTVLLARRYMEQTLKNAELPKFGRVVVARMSDITIEAMLEHELLPKEFKARLDSNLGTLKSLCTQHNVPFEEHTWAKLPLFHGFIYGKMAYIGRWTVGTTGLLSHDSPLHRLSGRKYSNTITVLTSAAFPSAELGNNVC
ncbi:hypothetical protein [Methylomonas sp. MgM2]